jgi:hypothetical protein
VGQSQLGPRVECDVSPHPPETRIQGGRHCGQDEHEGEKEPGMAFGANREREGLGRVSPEGYRDDHL